MPFVMVILLVKYSLVTGVYYPATVYKYILLHESCCQHSALTTKYLV